MSELKADSTPSHAHNVGRAILIGLAILLLGFLILGSLGQSGQPEQPGFGLQSQPFLVLAFLSFAGGLLSFLSPCTLPILPAYFAFAFQSGRRQIALNTIVFMLGLATMFALLGASASFVGRFLLQSQQLLLLVGGSLVLVFGVMSLLGKGFAGMASSGESQVNNRSLGGSFIFGLTFAIGWSSCVGPILGAVLTLAAQTQSVGQGTMLLFIYALGLGLPLIIVSTFFGRASRDSWIWRVMKGRGFEWNTHMAVIGLVWGLAIWRILVAAGEYAFRTFDFLAGQQFTAFHEYGLLLIALAGAMLWVFTLPGDKRTTLHLHTTQAISGALFILLGLLLLSGRLATFNALIPPDMALWFADLEEKIVLFFNR